MPEKNNRLETIVSLAKRRGLVFPASEIYGGLAGFYDYGPYGTQMVMNIKNGWWDSFVRSVPNIYGLDSAVIQNSKLWEASGHVAGFNDPMVACHQCKTLFRADSLLDTETTDTDQLMAMMADKDPACEICGKHDFGSINEFNMMFKTSVGAKKGSEATAFLRPETAGGIFTNFELVRETTRAKLPFGIGQIGKAFRNEISPRDFLFRLREFEQMEVEYFVKPKSAEQELTNWKKIAWDWLLEVGLEEGKLSWHQHDQDERAHYAVDSWDIYYDYPFGQKELWGIANRSDYDLKAHAKASGKSLSYFDQETKQHITPFVIEPSLGVSRLFLALLDSAYHEEKVRGEQRVVLKLRPGIAPIDVAVLPLSKKPELNKLSHKVYKELVANTGLTVEYDQTQSIGKRYRRQDEIGTPFCLTVDFESIEDHSVTVRDRDSMQQVRVKIEQLDKYLNERL